MRLRRGFPMIATAAGSSVNTAVASYVAAAAANGGTVSAGRQTLLTTLINASMDLDHWWNTDDIPLLTAEDAGSALTTLKRNILMTAVNAPTFTIDRGYEFDGVTNYINTNVVPVIGVSSGVLRLGVYDRSNVASNGYAMGTINSSLAGAASVRGKTGAGTTASIQVIGGTYTFAATDSRGLTVGSSLGTATSGWKNGVAQTGATIATSALSVDRPFYLGARNNGADTAATFRPCTLGSAEWGRELPGGTATELAWYNALQTFMTAIGANV